MIAQPVMPDAPKTRAWRPVLEVLVELLFFFSFDDRAWFSGD
jgi:hypothetical protein